MHMQVYMYMHLINMHKFAAVLNVILYLLQPLLNYDHDLKRFYSDE